MNKEQQNSLPKTLTVEQAVQAALREAEKEDVILAFGSLSYLHQIKEAYDRAVCKKRDER